MIYRLLDADSPMLKVKLEPFTLESLQENWNMTPAELKENLAETMRHYKGIGLSANQCGISVRAFVMYTSLNPENIELFMNPKIVWESEETENITEGCLTFPGVFMSLKRPKTIEIEYMDAKGETQTRKFTGLTARVFQHEYDHMEGTNFTERASKLKLQRALKKAKKKFNLF